MAQASSYTYQNVVVTIAGLLVEGFFDGDDAITIEPGVDTGTGLVGADGSSIWSGSADNSATITLNLMHTSDAHRLLTQLLQVQRTPSRRSPGFSIAINEVGSNEGGSADRCYILTPPTDSKGKAATVRSWVLWTGDYRRLIPNGGAIL